MSTQGPRNRLRELRDQHDERDYDVAAVVRRDVATVRKYETGKSDPPASVLIALARHWDVTVDYLLGLDRERAAA